MWHNGEEADAVTALPGDTIRLGSELLLVCVRRPAWKASARGAPPQRSFARPDEDGIVGESPAAVALRENLLFAAPRTEHVLILGQSGTGKELVAQAIHAHSARSGGPFVARNAATLPEGLVDSELFGHARNYPNAGMAERSGLLGAASGGTLFLDEIAELPLQLQSHLLRVMDDGEYQRLGEAAARKVDLRVVAATNRPTALRSDLAARFKITVHTEGLNDRREDIPLILLHLARNLAGSSADLRSRLFGEGDLHGMPELPIEFVDALVRHDYTTHVRELESLLWRHLSGARGSSGTTGQATSPVPARPTNIPREALVAALEANRWSLERTWRALGLGSRHVLSRLMTRHGLSRR
jgi:DNA-binding NtrC family response regulator